MDNRTNIIRLKSISNLLKGIDIDVVFVGGATVALYTDQLGGGLRPTDDVDVVVELATYSEFAALENRLRSIGFENDQDSKIVCRYKIEGLIVDIMPTDENIKPSVKGYLKKAFSKMLNEDSFEEGLVAHLAPLTAEQQLERIVNELKMFCEG